MMDLLMLLMYCSIPKDTLMLNNGPPIGIIYQLLGPLLNVLVLGAGGGVAVKVAGPFRAFTVSSAEQCSKCGAIKQGAIISEHKYTVCPH